MLLILRIISLIRSMMNISLLSNHVLIIIMLQIFLIRVRLRMLSEFRVRKVLRLSLSDHLILILLRIRVLVVIINHSFVSIVSSSDHLWIFLHHFLSLFHHFLLLDFLDVSLQVWNVVWVKSIFFC